MTSHFSQNKLDCTHDPAHPDHLICVERKSVQTRNPFKKFFTDRYFRHYHRLRKYAAHHLFVDITLVAGIFLLSLFVTSLAVISKGIQPQTVDVSVKAVQNEVISGREHAFVVQYKNVSGRKLSNVVLTVHDSSGFIFSRFEETSFEETKNQLNLDSLDKDEKGSFHIIGTPVSALQTDGSFSVQLSFKDAVKKTIGSVTAKSTYRVEKSALSLSLSIPKQAASAQRITGMLLLENQNSALLKKGSLKLIAPPQAVFEQPKNRALNLSNIQIPVSIKFLPNARGNLEFKARVYAQVGSREILQAETRALVAVSNPTLNLQVRKDTKDPLKPGQGAQFTLQWDNQGDGTLTDVKVGVKVTGNYVKPKGLSSRDGSAASPNVILWTANHRKELSKLTPRTKGSGTFSTSLLSSLDLSKFSLDHDFSITLQPFASYVYAGGRRIDVSGTPLRVDMSSQIGAHAYARYYTAEGDQIGRGPLPPRNGKTTRYQIFLVADGGIHPLENAKVTAIIPDSVTWTGLAPLDGDNISFDENSRTITWTLGTVPVALGGQPEVLGAVFELALTPPASLIGKETPLLTDIKISGTDAVTQASLSSTTVPVTTRLTYDKKAQNKDKVQP